jgi:hypothetical protein
MYVLHMCAYMLELEIEIRLMITLADYSRHLPRDVANAKQINVTRVQT